MKFISDVANFLMKLNPISLLSLGLTGIALHFVFALNSISKDIKTAYKPYDNIIVIFGITCLVLFVFRVFLDRLSQKINFLKKNEVSSLPIPSKSVSHGDLVEGDKIQIINSSKDDVSIKPDPPSPVLALELIYSSRPKYSGKEISFQQTPGLGRQELRFGLSLQNLTPNSLAKGIQIGLMFYSETNTTKTIKFRRPPRYYDEKDHWKISNPQITAENPASFFFDDPNLSCHFGQIPITWEPFYLVLDERITGLIKIDYSISVTNSNLVIPGNLKIILTC